MEKMFFTHTLTLLFGSSGNRGLISLWSRASFLPSLVILSILSSSGSTLLSLTLSARSEMPFKTSFCSWVGIVTIVSYSASGTAKSSISAVLISATSLNIAISSGRL